MTEIDKLEKAAREQAEAEFLELIKIDAPSWGEQELAKALLPKLTGLGIEAKLDEWHYVMLSGIKDGMVYMFDPYFHDTAYEDYPRVQVVLDQPYAYNRIIPADMFNTQELSLYALGPVEEREAVLLGNQNTLLTAEKTIEYFI